MLRRSPLRRTKRLNQKRKTPRRRPDGYMDDVYYRAWVRSLGVCFVQVWAGMEIRRVMALPQPQIADECADLQGKWWDCLGPIEADHMADWDRGRSFCEAGEGWTREQRKIWEDPDRWLRVAQGEDE